MKMKVVSEGFDLRVGQKSVKFLELLKFEELVKFGESDAMTDSTPSGVRRVALRPRAAAGPALRRRQGRLQDAGCRSQRRV